MNLFKVLNIFVFCFSQRAYNVGSRACKAWADSDGGKVPIEPVAEREDANQPLRPVEVATASAKIGQLLGGPQGAENFAALDGYMMSQLNPLASEIVAECLPSGLAVPFPANVSQTWHIFCIVFVHCMHMHLTNISLARPPNSADVQFDDNDRRKGFDG